jgi:hypothetical protein
MAILHAERAPITVPINRGDELAAPRDRIRLLGLSDHRFVMIDAEGGSAEEIFKERMPGLYAAAYGVHFALKRRGVDERVWPLEAMLWATDGVTDFQTAMAGERSTWRWTLMIALPDEAIDEELEAALDGARMKLPLEIAVGLRIEQFEEGLTAQIMHIGPYADEQPSIERLLAGIDRAGYRPRGRHHEIYLGDPRRAAPDKLRTILRQPIAPR